MNNKIIFWETETKVADLERTTLWNAVKKLNLIITTNREELKGTQLIFLHGGNKRNLLESTLDGSDEYFIKAVEGVWKVIYGGNPTIQDKTEDEMLLIQYINLKDLSDRLNYIVPRLQNEKTTSKLLEELLFDFDPMLEELLMEFSITNPFETNHKLENLKSSLQKRVKGVLAKK